MPRGTFILRGFVRKFGAYVSPGPVPPSSGVDPGYGVEEGGQPTHPIYEPDDDLEIWPAPGSPAQPIYLPDERPELPPGTVWPPLPGPEQLPYPLPKNLWVIAFIPGVGRRYVKISLAPSVSPKPPSPQPTGR